MSSFQTSAGHQLFYQIAGADDHAPVVLIGSIGSTHRMWDKVVPLLAEELRVITMDARGHGQSATPSGPYSTRDLAQDVVDLLDHLELESAHLVGLSIGGQTALQVAFDHPQRVRRIVVSNTGASIGTPQGWADRAAVVAADGLDSIAEAIVANWLTPTYAAAQPAEVAELIEMLLSNDPVGYAASCHALAGFDAHSWLGQITAPLLAIGATGDGPTPPAVTRQIADGVPNGQFVEIPGTHIPAYEVPDEYAAAVLGHLIQTEAI